MGGQAFSKKCKYLKPNVFRIMVWRLVGEMSGGCRGGFLGLGLGHSGGGGGGFTGSSMEEILLELHKFLCPNMPWALACLYLFLVPGLMVL